MKGKKARSETIEKKTLFHTNCTHSKDTHVHTYSVTHIAIGLDHVALKFETKWRPKLQQKRTIDKTKRETNIIAQSKTPKTPAPNNANQNEAIIIIIVDETDRA